MEIFTKLLPAQKLFLEMPDDNDSEIDVSLYQGGYGSGKTFSGSLLGTLLCLKYAGIRGLCGGQTFPLIRDTTLVSYKEHFERMGLVEGRDWWEVKSENKICFSNGSEILFRHLLEPDKIKSLNLGFIEIEEMSDVPEATFKMLLGRLRQTRKPEWGEKFKYRLFGHTNPEGSKGYIYKMFVKERLPNYRRIIAPTTDNEANLPKGFIQAMRDAYDDEYYRRNVLGEDSDFTSALATKGFIESENVCGDLRINENFPIHVCCDFNTDPMCWYIVQHYNGMVYILHEIVECYTDTRHTSYILADLLRKYKSHRIIFNGDASGNYIKTTGNDYQVIKTVMTEEGFTNFDFELLRKNPSVAYRLLCWNNMMRNKKGESHIRIHKQCKYLIYDIQNLEVIEGSGVIKKPSTSKIKNDSFAKFLTHPTDSCSYFTLYYYPVQEEVNFESYSGSYTDAFGSEKYELEIGT